MIDSKSWTCRGCGAPFIGHRPADDTCAECVTLQVTTVPPAAQPAAGDRRVGYARTYLAAIRPRKLRQQPREALVREAAELRKSLGQVLDFITEALAGVVPVTALAELAGQLEERLGDELASRQAIAEAALGQLRELAGQAGLPAVTAVLPDGSALLSPDDLGRVLGGLADGAAFRQERASWPCPFCAGNPDGVCATHLDDVDQADAYQALAARLGGAE